jgi:hypothetical protein
MNKLDGLDCAFRKRVEGAIAEMDNDDILHEMGVKKIIVVEGLRPLAIQMAYYSRGRMEVKDVKAMYEAAGLYTPTDKECLTKNTWTLKSRHLEGKAVDLAPSKDGKTIWWNAPLKVWVRMGEIGKKYGLVWGGDWKEKDLPHFEMQERI